MDDNSENIPLPSVESLKEQGNSAVKKNKFEEAVLHYTHGIKLDQTNYVLFSNRSFAFLKIQQYSLALEDALQTIKINPMWPKGHFRKGEVEFATGQYEEAYLSYELAFKLKPDDVNIFEAMERTKRALAKERQGDDQIPWVGAGVGIVIGVSFVIADYFLTVTPTHPLLMAIITIVIAIFGYAIAKLWRRYCKAQKKSLLERDKDLFGSSDSDGENNKNENKTSPRYTKSQARQRFKKGKM